MKLLVGIATVIPRAGAGLSKGRPRVCSGLCPSPSNSPYKKNLRLTKDLKVGFLCRELVVSCAFSVPHPHQLLESLEMHSPHFKPNDRSSMGAMWKAGHVSSGGMGVGDYV